MNVTMRRTHFWCQNYCNNVWKITRNVGKFYNVGNITWLINILQRRKKHHLKYSDVSYLLIHVWKRSQRKAVKYSSVVRGCHTFHRISCPATLMHLNHFLCDHYSLINHLVSWSVSFKSYELLILSLCLIWKVEHLIHTCRLLPLVGNP